MTENNIISFNDQYYVRYEVINYRNYEIPIISDLQGDYFYFKWNNEIVDLGYHPVDTKETICAFIDRKLDLISNFSSLGPEYEGACLRYFNNEGYRDVKLSYRGRVIKIFLVIDEIDPISLHQEAVKLLQFSGLLKKEEPF